jgi:hypothetical protein
MCVYVSIYVCLFFAQYFNIYKKGVMCVFMFRFNFNKGILIRFMFRGGVLLPFCLSILYIHGSHCVLCMLRIESFVVGHDYHRIVTGPCICRSKLSRYVCTTEKMLNVEC